MKKRMTAALILCLLLCMQWVCFAAQSEPVAAQPDLMRDCSITVHLKTVTDEPVLDGQVQLLQVAALREDASGQYYELNAGFGALSFDPVADWQKEGTAEALAAIAQSGNLPYSTAPFSEGIAKLEPLAPGLYLLMQTAEVLVSYTAMPPCLVLVPQLQEDGTLAYDVDCYPKPVTTKPPTEVTFDGEKKIEVKNGQAPADTEFSFVLTPEKADQPMPKTANAVVDPQSGAAVVTRKGKGTFSFGELPIDKQDIGKTYRYTMHEIKGTARDFSYDTTMFTVTVTVTDKGNGEPQTAVTIVDENKKSVDHVVFTNIYAPSDKPEIPRTGQLWWPVLLLACSGLLLLVIGFGRRARAKRDD